MADNRYQPGDAVPLVATFKDGAGNLADTTVTMSVRKPDGTTTSPTPSRTGLGTYTYTQSVDQVGLWWYTFKGSGAVTAVEQGSFVVEQLQTDSSSLTPRALVTLEETREYVLGSIVDDSNDYKLIRRINAMSEAVYGYTEREWLPITTNATRTFAYRGYGMVPLKPYDLRSATQIKVYTDYPNAYQFVLAAGDTATLGEYRLRPVGGEEPSATYRWVEFGTHPYTALPLWSYDGYYDFHGQFQVSITGDWGIGAVPEDVKLATLIAVDNNFVNKAAGAQAAGPQQAIAQFETDTTPDAIWRALPEESRALLNRYRETTVLIA